MNKPRSIEIVKQSYQPTKVEAEEVFALKHSQSA